MGGRLCLGVRLIELGKGSGKGEGGMGDREQI